MLAVVLTVVIVGYTAHPKVDTAQTYTVSFGKVVSWASAKAKCDRGVPSPITVVNGTYTYTCESIPLNRQSCIAVAIVGGSLAVMVGDYDPDLTMLFATFLLMAFKVVTPAQGLASLPDLALHAIAVDVACTSAG